MASDRSTRSSRSCYLDFPYMVLIFLSALAIYTMHIRFRQNGYQHALSLHLDHHVNVLPGSDTPIVRKFTGSNYVDYWLRAANCVFANVVDGTDIPSSIYAVHFAGQMVGIMTIMAIEGMRAGMKRTGIWFFVLWAMFMQTFGYGVFMPLCSRQTLQYFMAFWQYTPAWVSLLNVPIALIARTRRRKHHNAGVTTPKQHDRDLLQALRRAYIFAIGCMIITHLATLAFVAVSQYAPQYLPYPALRGIRLTDVFLPPAIYPVPRMRTMARAVHDMLLFDQWCGSAAMLVWMRALDNAKSLAWWRTLAAAVIMGPVGPVLLVLWKRDRSYLDPAVNVEGKGK